MEKKAYKKIEREYDHLDLGNAASANECTGLIQVPPECDEDIESYLSIADYRAPNSVDEDDKQGR